MILEVTPGGIDQIDPATNKVLCSYDYRNIEGFVDITGYQGGFCILYGGFSRLVSIKSKYLGMVLEMFIAACLIMELQHSWRIQVYASLGPSCGASRLMDRS